MHVESVGDVRAVSPKGAMGLMQIMPETWAALRARYGLGANPMIRATTYWPARPIFVSCMTATDRRVSSPPTMRVPARYEEHLAPVDRCRWRRAHTSRCWRRSSAAVQTDDTVIGRRRGDVLDRALLFPRARRRRPTTSRSSRRRRNRQSTVDASALDLTGLAPQSGNLFVRRDRGVSRNDRDRLSSWLWRAVAQVWRRVGRCGRNPATDGKIKAPTSVGRMWLVGLGIFGIRAHRACWRFSQISKRFQCSERHRRLHSAMRSQP